MVMHYNSKIGCFINDTIESRIEACLKFLGIREPPKKRRGRPSSYTQERINTILDYYARVKSRRLTCQTFKISPKTLIKFKRIREPLGKMN